MAAPTQRSARRRWTLLVTLVVVCAYLAVGMLAAERLSVPTRVTAMDRTPAHLGASFEAVEFRSTDDRVDLAAWLLRVAGSEAGVVLVHGIEANRSTGFDSGFVDVAVVLQRAGYQVLLVDLRGHGASGDARYAFGLRERYDVIAAVTYLVEEGGVRPGSVGVLGVSLGGASALEAAAIDPRIGAVWTDSAYAEFAPVVVVSPYAASVLPTFLLPGVRLAYRMRFGIDPVRARPVEVVPALAPLPFTIVHGRGDRLVPVAHAQLLSAAAPWADAWIVEGAGHTEVYAADPDLYGVRLVEFFDLAFRTALAEAGRD
ncbi:MAG: alpha/beta fold hydrolase [Trueperaceae bacterium]|nr:alpha/beta fold hydrolase [Trueperaceae bacterium]